MHILKIENALTYFSSCLYSSLGSINTTRSMECCYIVLLNVYGNKYNGNRPVQHLGTVLYKNLLNDFLTKQLLKFSTSKHPEMVKSLWMKLNSKSRNLDSI